MRLRLSPNRWTLLWKEDLLPYRQLAKAAADGDGFACGLLRCRRVSPHPSPAYWITEILVRKMGYQGLIVSDDMEMGGILNYTGIAEAAVRSLAAGTHVVEICRDPALVFAAYEAVLRRSEKSTGLRAPASSRGSEGASGRGR